MGDVNQAARGHSTLKVRNVRIGRRRTSLRLESAMWDALQDIAAREKIGLNELLTSVAEGRSESSFTASVRVFTLSYFRELANRHMAAQEKVTA